MKIDSFKIISFISFFCVVTHKLLSLTSRLLTTFVCLCFYFHATDSFAHNAKLLNYSLLGELSKENANQILQKVPPLHTLVADYSVSLYKIQYETQAPDGSKTRASGLVSMPLLMGKKTGIVSYFHGTRVTRQDVPSNLQLKDYIYPAVFSSNGGYMLVMPDYLGLGESDLPIHPYVHAESLARSSIDMLMAAKELARNLNYPLNDDLFLGGYSEGGFTALVTYESLLKDYPKIRVAATAPGSAPYDWNETMRFIVLDPGPRATLYGAYLLYSMQTWFHYWSGLDMIFKPPFDTAIPLLFDGSHEYIEILASLPNDPREIIKEAFIDGLLNGADKNNDELLTNFNHYNFVSKSPLLLVGSKGDRDVPYRGAEIAYEQLKRQSNEVYIKSVSDTFDHKEALPFVINEQLEFFKQNTRKN